MEGFKKYIADNHPDPDSLLIVDTLMFEQLCLLAERYAVSYHLKSTCA